MAQDNPDSSRKARNPVLSTHQLIVGSTTGLNSPGDSMLPTCTVPMDAEANNSFTKNSTPSKDTEYSQENLEEILLLLPMKTLGRLKCVSKSVGKILSDKYWMKAYREKTLRLLLTTDQKKFYAIQKEKPLNLVRMDLGSFDNIILSEEGVLLNEIIYQLVPRKIKYSVLNLSMGRCWDLPPLPVVHDSFTCSASGSVGVTCSGRSLRVFRVDQFSSWDRSVCYIRSFDFETGYWEPIVTVNCFEPNIVPGSRGIQVEGHYIWLARKGGNMFMACFTDSDYSLINLPNFAVTFSDIVRLFCHSGYPAVSITRHANSHMFNVWMWKSGSWEAVLQMDLSGPATAVSFHGIVVLSKEEGFQWLQGDTLKYVSFPSQLPFINGYSLAESDCAPSQMGPGRYINPNKSTSNM